MKRRWEPIHYYVVLTAIYLLLNFLLPPNRTTRNLYHLTVLDYHVLVFLVILPYVAIWYAAFYGYGRLKSYAASIASTSEGPIFKQLARGATWLAWGLPIPALITTILNAVANSHPGFTAAATIIDDYVALIIPLIAFSYISTSSRLLLERHRLRVSHLQSKALVFGFVTLGVLFCYFVLRQLSSLGAANTHNPYYLPTWLIIVSIIIPYLFTWFIGLLGAYEMWLVARNSSGLLYRRGLRTMANAIGMIVAASIAIQYIHAVLPAGRHLSLGATIVWIYFILLIYTIGFVLLAVGSNKLKRIEEA